jgi:hypothetical protein
MVEPRRSLSHDVTALLSRMRCPGSHVFESRQLRENCPSPPVGSAAAISISYDAGMPDKAKTMSDSALVDASPEAVMAWWFHSDRWEEFRDRLERPGARDVSVSGSRHGDIAVLKTAYRNRRDKNVHQRQERRLTPEGMAPPSGDRFVAQSTDILIKETQSGREITRTCAGRIEFIPQSDGSTQVVSVHRHVLTGGTWAERLGTRRGDGALQSRQFAELIDDCHAAVSS